MSPLRHPIEEIHDRWGKAGLIVAVIALVAALGGSAFAASALTGKQKKEVTAIAKKFAGKSGASGANGTNGTNGATGQEGKQGSQGLPGTNGTNGENGKSVVIGTAGTECGIPGGRTVEIAGEPSTKKAICNGKEGPEGEKGEEGQKGEKGDAGENGACSNANPDCTLPENASLRGTWGAAGTASGAEQVPFPNVSFVLPLKTAPHPSYVGREVLEGEATADLTEGSRILTNAEHLIRGYETFGATVTGPGIPPETVVVGCGPSSGTYCGNTSCGTNNPPHSSCTGGFQEIKLSKAAEVTAAGVTLTFGLPEGCTVSYEFPEELSPLMLRHTIGAAPGHLCLFESEGQNLQTEFFGVYPLPLFRSPVSGDVFETDPEGFGLLDVAKEAGHYELRGNWVVTGD